MRFSRAKRNDFVVGWGGTVAVVVVGCPSVSQATPAAGGLLKS